MILQRKGEKLVSVKDIATILHILEEVRQLYNDIYDVLPSEDKKDKSTLEATVDVLRYYAKIRSFLKKVYLLRKQLLSDLDYVSDKIHLLTADGNDMLFFYGLQDKYLAIKIKAEPHKLKDSKFSIYFQMMDDFVLKFNENVQQIGASSQDVLKLNDFFTKEIDQLQSYETDSSILNALDKFDKILMLSVKLIELKIDIETSVHKMKESFIKLQKQKDQVEEVLNNINLLADHFENGPATTTSALVSNKESLIAAFCFTVILTIGAFV